MARQYLKVQDIGDRPGLYSLKGYSAYCDFVSFGNGVYCYVNQDGKLLPVEMHTWRDTLIQPFNGNLRIEFEGGRPVVTITKAK